MPQQATRVAVPLTATIRHLRHSEEPQFRAHLMRLDPASRRDRFNGPTNDAFIETYARRCFHDGTIVLGHVENGRVTAAAELHECPDEARPTGEIAFSVEPRLHRRGLGGLLFARLIETARTFGYERLRVTTHPQNEAMKRLARRFDAALTFEAGETVGMIELEPAQPLPARPGAGAPAARDYSASG